MGKLETVWGQPMQRLVCNSCNQTYLTSSSDKLFNCPDCPSSQLSGSNDESSGEVALQPELVVPFSVSAETITQSANDFVEKYHFTPADLTTANLTSRMQKLFLPMYLVDSDVTGSWQSEIGFEAHSAPYGRQSEDTTWEARAGQIERSYDNVRSPALGDHDRAD